MAQNDKKDDDDFFSSWDKVPKSSTPVPKKTPAPSARLGLGAASKASAGPSRLGATSSLKSKPTSARPAAAKKVAISFDEAEALAREEAERKVAQKSTIGPSIVSPRASAAGLSKEEPSVPKKGAISSRLMYSNTKPSPATTASSSPATRTGPRRLAGFGATAAQAPKEEPKKYYRTVA